MTIAYTDAQGVEHSLPEVLAGRQAVALARSVGLSTEDAALLTSILTALGAAALGAGREYETIAASQTDQALGATGGAGDDLDGLLIIPATTSPGAVSIKDGNGSAITVFTGGASSVSCLVPFFIPLNLRSLAGAWKVTTGANVSAIGSGNFA